MSKVLTKDQIIGANDLKIETLEIAEWGGSVCIRELSGEGRDVFENLLYGDKGDLLNLRAKLCAMTICDEKGNMLFTAEDVAALGNKSGTVLDRIFKAAQVLNGLNPGAIEDAEKNS